MFPTINPLETNAWKALALHHKQSGAMMMTDMFAKDTDRFNSFSIAFDDMLFDYSKNIINKKTIELLIDLAEECKLKDAIQAMFTGEKINKTEGRPVLHTALRNFSSTPLIVDGNDIMPGIRKVLEQVKLFCEKLHNGKHTGFTGKRIKNIVNIGIGGSDLGPAMISEALKPYKKEGIHSFFISNIDPAHIGGVLKDLSPDETLFIIASKTFTTQETITNAYTARQWFLNNGGNTDSISKHFVALSTNDSEVMKFGIIAENIFPLWDWVGGRYSLWGAIGLSIAASIGFDNFIELLKGAQSSDNHFRNEKFEKNIPVIMALIGIWYRNFYNCDTEAILPYDQHMHRFAAYFQQGNMESNGKSVDRNGNRTNYATGPIVWGEPGTNGQHAFYQLLHQGSVMVPCDFIASANNHFVIGDHHQKLLSNFFAQTEALMKGSHHVNPYRVFEGNRPSNSFLLKKLTPFSLGQLIALYEHKIFVQGVIWNIFSFDQWGVELGKKLADKINSELGHEEKVSSHDASTNGLINAYKIMREK